MGEHASAIEDYDVALELSPGFAEACYNRGISYYYPGDNEKAVSDGEKAVELFEAQGQQEYADKVRSWIKSSGQLEKLE